MSCGALLFGHHGSNVRPGVSFRGQGSRDLLEDGRRKGCCSLHASAAYFLPTQQSNWSLDPNSNQLCLFLKVPGHRGQGKYRKVQWSTRQYWTVSCSTWAQGKYHVIPDSTEQYQAVLEPLTQMLISCLSPTRLSPLVGWSRLLSGCLKLCVHLGLHW